MPFSILAPGQQTADFSAAKTHGVHYTPDSLAEFVARRLLAGAESSVSVVLDPACGDGSLLLALANAMEAAGLPAPHLVGVDRDPTAIEAAGVRLSGARTAKVTLVARDFLLDTADDDEIPSRFDAVITNPPYVRTQVLGSARAQELGARFGLTGRVDLYHVFVAAVTERLEPEGTLALLCSNRFVSTRGGQSLRDLLVSRYQLGELWDLGDSKLFSAAVLPAIVVARKSQSVKQLGATFVKVYESSSRDDQLESTGDLLSALASGVQGRVHANDRVFEIERGTLATGEGAQPWRLATTRGTTWLETVRRNTQKTLGDFGALRVGIKTTADTVFIREAWDDLPEGVRPEREVLKPLLTHRLASRWTAKARPGANRTVLYTHEHREGRRRAIDLDRFPDAKAYLELHRERLEGRKYLIKAKRSWFEIWVPQQPNAWQHPKIVWPDISDGPRFFLDESGAVVNGDCYWLSMSNASAEEIALALAVANSSFAVAYYDLCAGNRLYGGKRRFITQYMEGLPIPFATDSDLVRIRGIVDQLRADPGAREAELELELDSLVYSLFGIEEIDR